MQALVKPWFLLPKQLLLPGVTAGECGAGVRSATSRNRGASLRTMANPRKRKSRGAHFALSLYGGAVLGGIHYYRNQMLDMDRQLVFEEVPVSALWQWSANRL
jgi:hypothetical protein